MSVIRSERPPAARLASNGATDANGAPDIASFEGEIREFVRRDVAPARRGRNEPETAGDPAADHVSKLVGRVSNASLEQIDRVIAELQGVREMLRSEGERVTREIAGFASLNHAAITSMQVLAESVAQWKNGARVNSPARS
jgi:hypothetical protein